MAMKRLLTKKTEKTTKMTKKYNIGCSVVGNRIYAFGRPKRHGVMPDDKVDVTKEAIYAVAMHLINGNTAGVSFDEEGKYLVTTDNREDYENMLKIHKKYLDSQEYKKR